MTEYDAYDLKPPRKKRKGLTEETALQVSIVAYYTKLCRVDKRLRENTRLYAVGANAGRRPMHQAALAKRMGEVRGVFDLCLMKKSPWQQIWIEVKAPDGRLSSEQKEWMAWLADTPVIACEVRSLDEFISILEA